MTTATNYVRLADEAMQEASRADSGYQRRQKTDAAQTFAMLADVMERIEARTPVNMVDSDPGEPTASMDDMTDWASGVREAVTHGHEVPMPRFTVTLPEGSTFTAPVDGVYTFTMASDVTKFKFEPVERKRPNIDPSHPITDTVSQLMVWVNTTRPTFSEMDEVIRELSIAIGERVEAMANRGREKDAAVIANQRITINNYQSELDKAVYAATALAMYGTEDGEAEVGQPALVVTKEQDRNIRRKMDRTTLVVESGPQNTKKIGIR